MNLDREWLIDEMRGRCLDAEWRREACVEAGALLLRQLLDALRERDELRGLLVDRAARHPV